MSITIPLKTRAESASASSPTGIRLKLPALALAGSTLSAANRESSIVRAVAAGVAVCDPKEALRIAEKARENPAEVIDPAIDLQYLNPLLDRVGKLLEDRSDAPAPNDQHRVAAQAVGADPVLVAAAHGIAEGNKQICSASRLWIAAIEPELLAKAAVAGAREKQLDLIQDQLGRLEGLEKQVKQLQDGFDSLEKRVAKLEQPTGASVKKGG
jgi:hypothetical protein